VAARSAAAREPARAARARRFFGAHHRVELDAAGQERLVGFNFSEEPTGALVNFFEYESAGFRLLSKATHRLEVPPAAALRAARAC
jgi:hypothetical protein